MQGTLLTKLCKCLGEDGAVGLTTKKNMHEAIQASLPPSCDVDLPSEFLKSETTLLRRSNYLMKLCNVGRHGRGRDDTDDDNVTPSDRGSSRTRSCGTAADLNTSLARLEGTSPRLSLQHHSVRPSPAL